MSQADQAKLDQQLTEANLSKSFSDTTPPKEEHPSKTTNISAAEGHNKGSAQMTL